MVQCPNWRCCQVIKRRDEIDEHFEHCWANKCNDSNMHKIGECGLQMIKCPNYGCNANIRRYKLKNHQTKNCQFQTKKSKRKLILTQAQRDRIQKNKQRALQRRAASYSSNGALSDDIRRKIEQNKQRALQRRRER